jgi:hypothetical protein
VVANPESLGFYRIATGQGDESFEKAFTVNPSITESQLAPVPHTEVTAALGEGNFAVARTAHELRDVMGDVRIGRELFPWLIPLLVLLFAAEHLLANRFYRNPEQTAEKAGRSIGKASQARNQSKPNVVEV